MSYFDDASLVMIPSGYKTSKVYSVKPTDGSGDLTFSRSNDTATRVNSAGLIEKVRTNLALYSEDLTNAAYVNQNANLTANTTTAPDGTTTADTYNEGTLSTAHRFYQQFTITANAEYGFSFYAKKNTLDVIRLVVNDLNENFRWFGAQFDLTNGTITATATGSAGGATYIGGSITNVGNGWYRCSVNGTINTTTALCFVHSSTSTAITSTDDRGGISYTGTSRTYFGWGFQFETGVTTAYIATTSAAVSVGPVANVPRLDYLNSSCPRLLLEPQRTNVNIYSESFGLSGSLTLATATYNTTTSPDGYVSADSFLDTTDNNIHALLNVFTKAASPVTYTYSLFVKAKDSGMKIQLSMDDAAVGGGDSGIFNPSTGTFITNMSTPTAGYTNPSRSVTSYGNGWYRISFTITTSTATFNRYNAFIVNASNSTVYAGTGTGVYVWGAQMETGAYATSYIPTLGSASTRSWDDASKTGITSLIGQTAGTLFVELNADGRTNSVARPIAYLTADGTTANRVAIQYNTSGQIQAIASSGGSTQGSVVYTITGPCKAAFAYNASGYELFVNGVSRGTFSGSLPSSLTRLDLNSLSGTFDELGGTISQVLIFPTRLSNSDLAALTA